MSVTRRSSWWERAWLARLRVELSLKGRSVVVLEASDAVGGRARTDVVDGFRLDRGFQVLLTAYPEAQRTLDLPALGLRAFHPGALVRLGGRFHRVRLGPINCFGVSTIVTESSAPARIVTVVSFEVHPMAPA
jgi:hypothetical protein